MDLPMKRTAICLSFVALASCALANLDVITTTTDLAAIAKSVGGANVKVDSIVKGVRDPHFIDAKPGDMSKLRGADLFIAIGLDLEVGYEKSLIQGSRNTKIAIGRTGHLYASSGISVLDKATGTVSRAQGDVHPNGNPHYWLDPYNARTIAQSMAARMGQLDPTNKSAYQSRADAFEKSVDVAMFGAAAVGAIGADKLWAWSSSGNLASQVRAAGQPLGGWSAKMEPDRGKAIVTYHKSWNYFAKRFGLRVVAQLEPKPGIPPTPGHIASVVRTMGAEKVGIVLQEPFYSTRSGQTVATRSKATLVVAPLSVGHTSAAKDYVSLMDTVVGLVSNAL
jgi:ABC-type Zn uptake system ZnuABC Zn-binding protein ZnuA